MQQLTLFLPVNNRYDHDCFMVSDCNQSAFSWLETWGVPEPGVASETGANGNPPHSNNDTKASLSGLANLKKQHIFTSLSGPNGSGKTHLAHIWADRVGALYLTAQQAISKDVTQLSESYSHFVIDLDNTSRFNQFLDEEWLFHFYNAIFLSPNKYVLLVSETKPNHWVTQLPDLKSRLATIMTVELFAPDENALFGVLSKQFDDRGLSVGRDVLQFMIHRMERSFEGVKTLVENINSASAAQGRSVTIPFVKQFL